jgi:acyl-CoA dehydrogenase
MNFDLSDDQKMLAEQANKLLAEVSTPDRLRQLIDEKADYDQVLWQNLAELGFLGAAIPEEFGGIGMSAMELAVVAEEVGRFNAAIPFVSSVVQAAKIIELAGSQEQKESWLPRIASGEIIATLAAHEGAGDMQSLPLPQCQLDSNGLSGKKFPVADGHYAHLAVVTCQHHGKLALALVDLTQDGIQKTQLSSFDELRPFAQLSFDQTPAELLEADDFDSEQALDKTLNYAAAITAFEQIGGTETCLYMARDYALERQIFGRKLGSYQAIKHKLAQVYVKLEIARSNAMYATWCLANNTSDTGEAIAVSRLSALDAFETAARENLQVHGGIGYTFEANCHFYYRRERLLTGLLGGKSLWSDKLINVVKAA